MVNFQRLLPGVVALVFYALTVDGSSRSDPAIRLNTGAFNFARDLINQGQFIADKKGEWNGDHPTRSEENCFIRDHGLSEYAKWHLGLDERHALSSKARYKFPFGDFQNVHRCGLLAVKARAHEYGYTELAAAADELLRQISVALERQRNSSATFRRANYRSSNKVGQSCDLLPKVHIVPKPVKRVAAAAVRSLHGHGRCGGRWFAN